MLSFPSAMYTVCQKTSHLWLAIVLTYTIRLQQFWAVRWCFVSSPHLSTALALPSRILETQKTAHWCNTCATQSNLQHSRLRLSWTMPPQQPWAERIDTGFRESYSSVNVSLETKRLMKSSSWLNSGNALIQHLSQKCDFWVSPFYQVVQKHVIWGSIVKHLLIAYFIGNGNISAKKMLKSVHICQSYGKPKVRRFWDMVQSFQFRYIMSHPARVVQWLDHLGAVCSRAWRALCAVGSRFNLSRGPVRRVRLHKSNYMKIIPMHTMIREIIPGRQQRVQRCPL